MDEKYQVAIYTRFNLPIRFGGVENRENIHLDENWLKGRVDLFKKYCLPSLLKQSDQNFTWFVCFAEGTSAHYVEEVCSMEQIIPIFANSQTQAVERSREFLSDEGVVVSTRLDSDDSLSFNYVESLVGHIGSIGDGILDNDYVLCFTEGCEYELDKNSYYRRFYLLNPFIALCESVSSGKKLPSIFKNAHFSMHQIYKTLLIPTEEPMWRINIHGDNVANTVKGELVDKVLDHLFE